MAGKRKKYVNASSVVYDKSDNPNSPVPEWAKTRLSIVGDANHAFTNGAKSNYDVLRMFTPKTWWSKAYAQQLKYWDIPFPNCTGDNAAGYSFKKSLGSVLEIKVPTYDPPTPGQFGGSSFQFFNTEITPIYLEFNALFTSITNECLLDFFRSFYGWDITEWQKEGASEAWQIGITDLFHQWWTIGHQNPDFPDPDFIVAAQAGRPLLGTGFFEDHYFNIATPVNVAKLKYWMRDASTQHGMSTLYIDYISEYNFFISQYEETLKSMSTMLAKHSWQHSDAEIFAPNMYIFLSEQEYGDATKIFELYGPYGATPYSDLLTLGGRVKNVLQDVMVDKQSINVAGPIDKIHSGQGKIAAMDKIKVGEKDVGDYFLKWSKVINEVVTSPTDENEVIYWDNWVIANREKYRHLCFIDYDTSIFEQAELKKHLFPMYNKIEFSTDVIAGFSDVLRETQLMYAFMSYLHLTSESGDLVEYTTFTEMVETTDLYHEDAGPISADNPFIADTSRISLTPESVVKTWHMQEGQKGFLDNVMNDFDKFNFLEPITITTDAGKVPSTFYGLMPLGSRSELFIPNYKNKFYQALLLFKFRTLYKKYIEKIRRSHKDVLDGVAAPSETICYKIEKLDKNGRFIQDIYIPNSSNSDIIKYYDTSIVYNKEYTYNIYAYVMVVGNKYKYDFDNTKRSDVIKKQAYKGSAGWWNRSWVHTEVRSTPDVKIFEIPYIVDLKTKTIDSPPIYPEVNIVPYRGIDNKLKFNFSSNTGRYFAKPIWFNEQEKEIIEELKNYQHPGFMGSYLDLENATIMFESDDPIRKYEIYKITPPESDSDILPVPGLNVSHKPKQYADFGVPYNTLENIDSWIDYNIKPNRKYYYMFRAIDQHGHFSNPSPIFQVELINNSGAIYPLIEVVEFAKPTLKTKTKPFRKYLQIIPTFEQGLIQNIDAMKTTTYTAAGLKTKDGGTAFEKDPKIGNIFSNPSDDDSAAARKFKIRLTSKSTGKKIDINVRFVHKHDNNDGLKEEMKKA